MELQDGSQGRNMLEQEEENTENNEKAGTVTLFVEQNEREVDAISLDGDGQAFEEDNEERESIGAVIEDEDESEDEHEYYEDFMDIKRGADGQLLQ